jgi:hypothetical protein
MSGILTPTAVDGAGVRISLAFSGQTVTISNNSAVRNDVEFSTANSFSTSFESGDWSHSGTTDPEEINVPEDGLYCISGWARYDAASSGNAVGTHIETNEGGAGFTILGSNAFFVNTDCTGEAVPSGVVTIYRELSATDIIKLTSTASGEDFNITDASLTAIKIGNTV